ncbi:hypothetical protein ACHAWF_002629, partial [Thalassiosira exigua]
ILRWDFDEPSTSVVFLDLNLRIENNRIITSTYQKPINLYQYLPPTSAHPPGMMKGIIFSLMKNYKRQNSKGIIFSLMKNYKRQNTRQHDYEKMALKLFRRHVARGWDPSTMKRFILEANRKLDAAKPRPTLQPQPDSLSNKERLFLHFEFHPRDIPRKVIRAIYDDTCHETFFWLLGIKQATVAYSRPKNIRERATTKTAERFRRPAGIGWRGDRREQKCRGLDAVSRGSALGGGLCGRWRA